MITDPEDDRISSVVKLRGGAWFNTDLFDSFLGIYLEPIAIPYFTAAGFRIIMNVIDMKKLMESNHDH